MIKVISLILIAFSLSCNSITGSFQDSVDLTFIHWNDFHAANSPFEIKPSKQDTFKAYYVSGAAYFKGYIDSLKRVNRNPVTVFAGDEFQGSPISGITRGQSQMDIITKIKTDVLTLGNHEFDYSDERVYDLISKTDLNYISANVFSKKTDTTLVKPYFIMEKAGLIIAFIGGMTDEFLDVSLPTNLKNTYQKKIIPTLRNTVNVIKSKGIKPDLWIAVTHNGVEEDKQLAKEVPDFDVIIGGHSHTYLPVEEHVGKTIIVQAGSKGRYIGELKINYSHKNNSISKFSYKLIETRNSNITPDKELAEIVRKQEDFVGKSLDEVIGELKVDWKIPLTGESNLGSFETDAFREKAGTDIAFTNNGGLRKEMIAGPIKVKDIWEINPFNNILVTTNVKGNEIPGMIKYTFEKAESFNQVSGLKIRAKKLATRKYEFLEILVNGKAIENEKTYSVVMNNYMGLQMKRIFGLDPETHPLTYLDAIDKDVVIEKIRKIKVVDQDVDGRIVIEE